MTVVDIASWSEFVTAHGGWSASVLDDRYAHAHPAHGNATIDAATGDVLGVFSVTGIEDMSDVPEVCSVCRDFPAYLATKEQ